jgi:hypothetical protein
MEDEIVTKDMEIKASAAQDRLFSRMIMAVVFMLCLTIGWCCYVSERSDEDKIEALQKRVGDLEHERRVLHEVLDKHGVDRQRVDEPPALEP